MPETLVRIYFKNNDYTEKSCLDIKLENGMLLLINKQFSDDLEDPIIEGFAIDEISSFDFIRTKGDDEE